MSRCFPFPPPGYVVNGGHDDEAMIDSMIKGEEEKSKKEHKRKERKRDKNDKKDKKRKEREGESEKHSHKRRRKEEVAKDVQKNHKVDNVFGKLKESVNDCLEKSSLTVERELVQSTSQNSCDSTLNSNEKEKQKVTLNGRHNNNNDDSTPNSNETRKENEKQPMDCRHNNNNNNDSESIIRIRLPIRRPPKDPEVITSKDHQPCPSREIKLDSVTRDQPQHPCSTSTPEHASKLHEEKRKEHTSKTRHKEKKLSSATREALQFLNLVENCVPNTIESRVELTNSEDEECWWLMKKQSSHKFDKQVNRNNETKQVMSTWPRASLLPEADVYALPYTVPF